ncbi:MAG: primosomal protein N' [Gammaproteobacteria bacterium]
MSEAVIKVAVPAPFAAALDYLPPAGVEASALPVGVRVRVPLGRRKLVGVVLGHAERSALADTRLRRVAEVLDGEPLVPAELLELVAFAARYYHYPPGEALAAVLPTPLRQGKPARLPTPARYRLAAGIEFKSRTQGQAELVARLHEAGASGLALEALAPADRARIRRLAAQGVVEPAPERETTTRPAALTLNPEQQAAAEAVIATLAEYAPFLLDGVTGSGKTEVYLEVIREVLARGRQALVIVPEIALTPQLIKRFEAALGLAVAVYHSGLAQGERLRVWLEARAGTAPVVIGTRSALFLPLAEPGLIVVDEEHDGSFKQQDGFRYHARDLAVYRARALGVPVILGTATPSLESLANVNAGRYRRLVLSKRAGDAKPPVLKRVDVRGQRMEAGLSNALLDAIGRHLAAGDQVLVFLNRRGFAPVVLCNGCGTPLVCKRCSARLTWHRERDRLLCHHCGAERPLPEVCPECGAPELAALGKGTERLELVLAERFPDVPIARVDRDATRRRGRLAELMRDAASGAARILVGTQMLAKGHDFQALTLAAIVDADQGLYGVDFRAPERMAQLITQVAGRAGRGARPGEVLIQTRHPDHPLLAELLQHGYAGFAKRALAEREAAGLPPYGALALIRAESTQETPPRDFLAEAAKLFKGARGLHVLGPAPAPMLRRAGRYRYQLLLEAKERTALQDALTRRYPKVLELPAARRVRIALDVDPADLG